MNSQQDDSSAVSADDLAAVMRLAGVVSAVVTRSIVASDETITLLQLRVLALVAASADVNPSAVATTLGVHMSNASRVCDRLVVAGWLHRTNSPTDRRNLVLTLTPAGASLLHSIMDSRRTEFTEILTRMRPSDRATLRRSLNRFADAAGEPEMSDLP